MKRTLLAAAFMIGSACALFAQRTERTLEKGWKFTKGDIENAQSAGFDDSRWEEVTVPHDWAIYGPFDRSHDLQNVAVTQNFETEASVKTGRTGGLPYVGVGWYRTTFDSESGKQTTLVFDGAMSEARVYVNGKEACFWPFGYNSFHCDVTALLNDDGKGNTLAVRLENRPQSSRWYPGAGLYRNVHVITTGNIHVPVWGTQITTPHAGTDYASVKLLTTVDNAGDKDIRIVTDILSPDGKTVATKDNTRKINHGMPFEQNFLIDAPMLWSPESPSLYKAVSRIYADGRMVDEYTTRFGIRSIEYVADKGFYLNGKHRKFQGVCNHHDLGPLGAAINVSALRHQLAMLKDMGCDAIRTAHNMPAPELVELCDEMGFMMMVEPFDEWDIAKCENGYHRYFNEWAERDMVNMLRQFRNNPCVVMWSIGNEVPTQCSPEGYKVAKFLQDICHREDPTRPVTCGMDQVSCVLDNGFAAMIDIPGFNYRAHRYQEAYSRLPQNIVLGSETSSTVSSRGVYKFPAVKRHTAIYDDHQSTGYDLEHCSWSNLPDEDFALADDYPWTIGQFVWTGFDYLGEPSPYDTDAWPSHSSLFGIIDLASLPKDRYWLYRSLWNRESPTLHILPHWTWPGREGENTPVFVYTSWPEAELFVNGKSYGRQRKLTREESEALRGKDSLWLQRRYRLMWTDVPYEPGEVKVVAYGADGKAVAEKSVHTAGKPHHIELTSSRTSLQADGKDLAYVTLRIVDKDGNLCPADGRPVDFKVKGAGKYRASANGDAACLDLFHHPKMHAFSGMLTVIVQSGETAGTLELEATAKGIKSGKIQIEVSPLNSPRGGAYATEASPTGGGLEGAVSLEGAFYKGADISWTTQLESEGHRFYNFQGEERECTALMKELGLNAVRLRVWVNPKDGWSGKEDMLTLAKRAKANGMELMVDFHYSDWWADPGKQHIPEAWKGLSYEEMKTALASHTKEVLELLKENGITPKWVQIGNETSDGFLWETGRAGTNMKQYAGLTTAGYEAAKSVFPDVTAIVHLDNGFDNDLYNYIFDGLKANGGKWDMIGMSLYPYWSIMYKHVKSADEAIARCMENIRKVSGKYGCDVMIVETGMESAKPEEGRTILGKIIREARHNTNGHCKGVFYWEPECKPAPYVLGAFTADGRPTVIMKAFSENEE